MRLMLSVTNRCNKNCAHCSASSTPEEKSVLTLSEMTSYIDAAADLAGKEYPGWGKTDPLDIRFTGGEPFLCFEEMLEAVKHARKQGAVAVGCTTNAYWARTPAEAREKVERLKKAGMSDLRLSCDSFHDSREEPDTVRNAFAAAAEANLPVGLKIVVHPGSIRAADVLRRLESVTPDTIFHVEELSLLPVGRARDLPVEMFSRSPGLPRRGCDLIGSFTVTAEKEVYPCCVPGWPEKLRIGGIGGESLGELLNTALKAPLFQVIRREGPIYFVPFLAKAGIRFDPGGFVNRCHLCHEVLRAAEGDGDSAARFNEGLAVWLEESDRTRSVLDAVGTFFDIPGI